MSSQPNPDELSTSFRHLLTAQVFMNDRLDRAETAIQKTAETMKELAEQQKHTDSNLAALTDIVRRWYERHGNGSGGEHAS